jgi:hypothetical protein
MTMSLSAVSKEIRVLDGIVCRELTVFLFGCDVTCGVSIFVYGNLGKTVSWTICNL